MNNKQDEPGTIEYKEPHGSAEGLCEKLVLETRQMGMEPGTLANSQPSIKDVQQSVIVRTIWARHWENDRANEVSVTEGRELCSPRFGD